MKTLEQLGRLGRDLLVRRDGPLTRELLLEPGKFGLGRVPARLAPEQTTTMVCGFCSTGCGLNLLLNKAEAVGLVPTTDYPVNLGMACPKGWEALTPLRGPGRATAPLLRKGGKLVEVARVTGNHQRLRRHDFDAVAAEAVRVEVLATNGSKEARVYEVRCYA